MDCKFNPILILSFLLVPLVVSAQPTNTRAIKKNTSAPASYFRVHFGNDVYQLDQNELLKISQRVDLLDQPEFYNVQLIGHTDTRGSLEYNQALSEKRATSVKKALVDLGIPAEQIQAKGLAFLKPADKSEEEESLARNRRVEIIIEKASWNVPSTYFSMPVDKPTEIVYERSGTKIQVPPNAFTYEDGTPVKGEVLVQYREFRDPADFIVSNIPMQLDYEGEPAYFNSTGMFEVRAYDSAGTSLDLKTDAALTMDFVQTKVEEGTQFWQFDETTQTWEEAKEEVAQFENTEIVEVPVGATRRNIGRFSLSWPTGSYFEKYPDTIAQLQKAYEKLSGIIGSVKKNKKYIADFDLLPFQRRFYGRKTYFDSRLNKQYFESDNYAGTHYITEKRFRKVKRNPEYYNIKFNKVRTKDAKLYIQIEDLTGENKELKAFKDNFWLIRTKDLTEMRRKTAGYLFSDIRIRRKRYDSRQFIIEVKYRSDIFPLRAKLYSEDKTQVGASQVQAQLRQYNGILNERASSFNDQLYQNKQDIELLWPCVQLLLPKEIGEDEKKMKKLLAAITDNRKGKFFSELELSETKSFNKYALKGYIFLTTHSPYFEKEFTSVATPDWQNLMDNYQEEVFAVTELSEARLEALTNRVPRINIKGMGIFNCDVLKKFSKEKKIAASFLDENGKPVDYRRIDVVHHRLNGVLSFYEPNIYIDLKSSTSILVFAADGRLLLLSAEQLKQLPLSGKQTYNFTVNTVGDQYMDAEQLRKLLRR